MKGLNFKEKNRGVAAFIPQLDKRQVGVHNGTNEMFTTTTTTIFSSIGQPITAVYHFSFVVKNTIQHSNLE